MSTDSLGTTARRYYQVVFIWMKDPEKFGRYLEATRPVVQRYGGALERMLLPETIFAEGMTKPDVVNVVFYDDQDAFTAFNRDPDFQRIVHLRSESIDMAAVGGPVVGGTLTSEDLAERLYLVEVAKYGPLGISGYRRYEEESEPVMRRYGHHVERVFSPTSSSGFSFEPDVVKVASFDTPEKMSQLHRDPAHPHIENDLYPKAVEQSVWVVGRVHPSTLERGV